MTTKFGDATGDGYGQSGETAAHPAGNPQHKSRGLVAVFLPALNEERGIGHVMDRIPRAELEAAGYSVSVWLVDGSSTDRTLEVGRDRGANVFVQTGRGKGNGMRQAFDHLLHMRDNADGGSFDREFYLMLDADGTYPPEAVPEFVEALASGNDVVLGSRFRGRMEDGAMTPLNAFGNHALTKLAQLLYRASVTDVCTGMWGVSAEALRQIPLEATGFDLEADLFGSACLSRARIHELPVDYAARIGTPKLIPLRSGLQIALRLLTRRLDGRHANGGPGTVRSVSRGREGPKYHPAGRQSGDVRNELSVRGNGHGKSVYHAGCRRNAEGQVLERTGAVMAEASLATQPAS
jgi:hypothetical protein